MPDLIRHPVQFILDSGFRRNDDFLTYIVAGVITLWRTKRDRSDGGSK
jgi:hypothetical protein